VESVAAHRLAAACGHLPLALRIAAANLIGSHHRTVEAFVDELVAGDRLSKLEIVGDDRSDVRVVFGLSYEALRTEPARLFRLLGLVLGPTFDAYAAANLAGLTLAEAGSLLDLLAAANLIQHAGPGRYQFHDLIRAYAAALCGEHDRPADRDAAYLRLVTYYATTVDAIAELLYPEWERVPIQSILEGPAREDLLTLAEQLDWLDAERPNLVAVARQPDGNAAHLVCSLASGMYCYLNTQRHDRDWRTMYTVGLAIATRADDRRAMAIMHFGLAMLECAHADTGAGLAHYDHAIDLYRELGDRRGEAQMMSGKCMVVLSMGKFETALPAAESVLAIQQEIGDRVGEAKTLGRIGLIYAENGPVREAVEVLSRALLICDEQEMRVGAMFMTLYLAFARLYSGDPNGAIVEFEVAAALCTELHYHEELADAYEGISSAYVALGQPEEACRHAERAVELLTGAVSSYQFEISTLVTLGEAQLSAGRIDEAMANLLRALEQAETLKFLLNVRRGELALASCHRHRGEYELATELLKTVEASTYQPYRGQALVELARIHLAQNDPSSAIEHASRGLEISRTCQYRIDEAQALWVLGEALRTQGERAEAELCLQSAISIFNEIGSRLAAQVKP